MHNHQRWQALGIHVLNVRRCACPGQTDVGKRLASISTRARCKNTGTSFSAATSAKYAQPAKATTIPPHSNEVDRFIIQLSNLSDELIHTAETTKFIIDRFGRLVDALGDLTTVV
jgi:hypothetical protein